MARTEKPELPDSFEWPDDTRAWYEDWRASRSTDHWDERQWQYMFDTAIVHAQVYGSYNFAFLRELHTRLAFMGLAFDD